MKKILSIIVAIMMLTSMMIFLAGCGEKKDKYEIKIYDDNWEEIDLRLGPDQDTMYRKVLKKFAYDGTPKIFNAIGFKNGVEFTRLEPKDPESYKNGIITLAINSYIDWKTLPVKIDGYSILYSFGRLYKDIPDKAKEDSKVEFRIQIYDKEFAKN